MGSTIPNTPVLCCFAGESESAAGGGTLSGSTELDCDCNADLRALGLSPSGGELEDNSPAPPGACISVCGLEWDEGVPLMLGISAGGAVCCWSNSLS
jgi:hypothetical protein